MRPARPLRRFLRPAGGSAASVTPTDRAMMQRALELARLAAEEGEVPVGAVVYDIATGDVLGEGRNDRERSDDPTGHAEHRAIVAACAHIGDWRLNHAALAVTLEPCAMCAGLIVNARLGRVVYGATDPKSGAARSLYRLLEDPRLNHRVRPMGGVLADESAALLRAFFRERRRAQRDKGQS